LIWIALATGFGFFIKTIPTVTRLFSILCIAGIIFLPFAAATTYWALFCQNYILGYMLLGLTLMPMIIDTGMIFVKAVKN
jgi:hypothetical protein